MKENWGKVHLVLIPACHKEEIFDKFSHLWDILHCFHSRKSPQFSICNGSHIGYIFEVFFSVLNLLYTSFKFDKNTDIRNLPFIHQVGRSLKKNSRSLIIHCYIAIKVEYCANIRNSTESLRSFDMLNWLIAFQ